MTDDDRLDEQLEEAEAELRNTFDEAKAVSDFVVILTTQVAVSTLFWILLDHARESGYAAKPVLAVVVVGLFAAYFTVRIGRIVELFVKTTVLRAGEQWPSNVTVRHAVPRAFGKALLLCIPLATLWGLGYAAAELLKYQIGK